MNARIVKTILSVSILLGLMGTSAKAQTIYFEMKIPFAFNVGDVLLPAGRCDVTKIYSSHGIFTVRALDKYKAAMRAVMPVERPTVPNKTLLIFNRYQEEGGEVRYFLSQIWVEGQDRGYEFYKHRVELETAKRAANRDLITIVVPRTKSDAE